MASQKPAHRIYEAVNKLRPLIIEDKGGGGHLAGVTQHRRVRFLHSKVDTPSVDGSDHSVLSVWVWLVVNCTEIHRCWTVSIRAFRDTGRQGGGKSTAPWGASWIASLCQCDRFIKMARPAFMTSISIVPPITSPFEHFCSCVSADGNGSAKRPMLETRGFGG